jgi:hypothetical protein
MKKFNKPPKLDSTSYYVCNLCNDKFLGSEYKSHKLKCAPRLAHQKYCWAIKRVQPIKKESPKRADKIQIQKGYYVCPHCNRAVLDREFKKHYSDAHPSIETPHLTTVKFYRKEFVNAKKNNTVKSKIIKGRYYSASKYSIEDEKAINKTIGKRAFYPKK